MPDDGRGGGVILFKYESPPAPPQGLAQRGLPTPHRCGASVFDDFSSLKIVPPGGTETGRGLPLARSFRSPKNIVVRVCSAGVQSRDLATTLASHRFWTLLFNDFASLKTVPKNGTEIGYMPPLARSFRSPKNTVVRVCSGGAK